MGTPKRGTSSTGAVMHSSVGALITKRDRYLLIDRAIPPLGFAGIAGHIDKGEEPLAALRRELREESGLRLRHATLLVERECPGNICSKGVKTHYWYLYGCEVAGLIKRNQRETKAIGWYTPTEIRKLSLEPIWKYWLTELRII